MVSKTLVGGASVRAGVSNALSFNLCKSLKCNFCKIVPLSRLMILGLLLIMVFRVVISQK